MRLFKIDAADSELFADKAANEKVQSFAGGWKRECITRPIQLETRRLRGDPDLTGWSLGTDHDLAWVRDLDFDCEHPVLQHDLNVVLIDNRVKRSIEVVQSGVTASAKLRFSQCHRQVL